MTVVDTSAPPPSSSDEPTWPEELYDVLRAHDVTIFGYVPDAGHKHLIERSIADPDVTSVSLTTEEEGMGLVVGAHLGGKRAVLLMQSSGVGNCINLLSLPTFTRTPFVTLVTGRGSFGEGNPWQYPMGLSAAAVLREAGVLVYEVTDPADVILTVRMAMISAEKGLKTVAVLLTQKLLGAKVFA
jgi:sulfopyruvate decarboxylase TPP-binding subunit